MSIPSPVLAAHGLTKWFADSTALDRVSLQVQAGCVHGLLGPNGAGKTTLLSVLLGLATPDEGVVRLFGRTRAQAGRGWLDGVAGFVESPAFYPYLSGRRNLALLAGLDGLGELDLLAEALDLVDLSAAAGKKVRGYSLGMRQRLGLAAALIRRPRLLILDEPGSGLDPAGLRDLLLALRRLADAGMAVLFSSHDIGQVADIADTVSILAEGRVAFAGSMERLRQIAPEPVWRLETGDDGAALLAAGRIAGLHAMPAERGGLRIVADRRRLDMLVIQLGQAGVPVRALGQDVTSLETLFFHLTGRAGQHPDVEASRPAPGHEVGA